MAIRGGASSAGLAKLMSGGTYRQAQARGKKAETGVRLKQRRKKIKDMAVAEIEAAEKEWKAAMEKAAGDKSGSGWGNLSTLLSVGSMFMPWLAPLSMGAQAMSAKEKGDFLNSAQMKEYKKNVLDKIDVGKYKNTFMEDYVKGSEESIGDAWNTSVDRMKSSLTGGLMQNLIFQLGTMGMGKGLGGGQGGGLSMPKLDFKDFFSNFGDKMKNFNLGAGKSGPASAIPSVTTPPVYGPPMGPITTPPVQPGPTMGMPPSPKGIMGYGGSGSAGAGSPLGRGYNPFKLGKEGWAGALMDPDNLGRLGASTAQYWQPGYNMKDLLMGSADIFSQQGNRPSQQAPSWLTNFNTGFWG